MTHHKTTSFSEALRTFDRRGYASELAKAKQVLAELRARFPLEAWSELPIERYALGQPNSEDTFCRWLEFKTRELGSIRGGNSTKLILYKRKNSPGWYFQPPATDENEAWQRLRGGFVRAFGLAAAGTWEAIDQIEELQTGPALRLKSVFVYFPESLIPIYSTAHLKHFLQLLRRPEGADKTTDSVRLSRALLSALRDRPELANWDPLELMRLMYWWADPRQQRTVVKIAPGREAKFWEECLEGSYICVGWDEVGDLLEFESEGEFRAAFLERFLNNYNGSKSAASRKAKELWTLKELEVGDLVVANRGTSKVLAVGTVTDPGYEFRPERSEHRHTVRVTWDTSKAHSIPPQANWALNTVVRIPLSQQPMMLNSAGGGNDDELPALATEAAAALRRKGQIVIHGPPGTGKTYFARRFIVYWLLNRDGDNGAGTVFSDETRLLEAEKALGDRITRLTFHPSYTYEDFVEGFKPIPTSEDGLALRLEPGVFRRVCDAARKSDKAYVILLDEINRANIPKVFGELITLLESDKRGMEVMLPQSKAIFSVPPNVYLVGTMNTADRSIKSLDLALRRRFAFFELMPDSDTLSGASIAGLALDHFLERLNDKIARREGREKQIGQSYFLDGGKPVTDPEEFARRFRQEIVPLLQEYCLEDYLALADVIGKDLVDTDAQVLYADVLSDPEKLVPALLAHVGNASETE